MKEIYNPTFKAWSVVVTASLFFFYEFIQMNMFNAISTPLMHAFNIHAEALGRMSSFYFIANVVFLIPAGMILDRHSPRIVILISMAICVLGTALLGTAHSYFLASLYRFFTGIGSAFCFLGAVRIASRWFPTTKLALATGVIVTMAMLGGITAQTPMTLLVSAVGWRHAIFIDAGLGILFLVLIALFVQDHPAGDKGKFAHEQHALKQAGYWTSMRLAFLKFQNWLGGIYTCFMNLPIGILGGLWGILYLQNVHSLDKIHAANVTSMLFLGTVFGSPLAGWISDRVGLRRLPMVVGSILSLLCIAILFLSSSLSLPVLIILFFLIGLFTSTQIISYPFVTESSPPMITAMSVSIVALSVQGGDALFQPVFGWLLDKHVFQRLHHYSTQFIPSDFHWPMLLFPIGVIVALVATFAIKETYCKPAY